MAEIYTYADETGDLDMTGAKGTSQYFGFGTAVFVGAHGQQLWEGLQLRCRLEASGVQLPSGVHAKNDSYSTRSQVFELIGRQGPRFDTTFLLKRNAYPDIKASGDIRLYKLAWYLHFKSIARQVSVPGDTLYVMVGSLQTSNKRDAVRSALEDVCKQVGHDRSIVPCIWNAASAWGIQVADYGLWSVQRQLEQGKESPWQRQYIEPTLRSVFTPWGTA